jgi:hypothetical protein
MSVTVLVLFFGWIGDVPLCDGFCRLYDLLENKMAIVAQMFAWGWEA